MLKVGRKDFLTSRLYLLQIFYIFYSNFLSAIFVRFDLPFQVKGRFEHNVDVTVGEDGEVAMRPLKSSPGVSPTSVELRKEAIWDDCWPNLQEGLNLGCSLYFEGPKKKKTKEQALRSFNEPLDLRTCLNSDNRDHLVGQLPQLWEPMFTHSNAVYWPWKKLPIFDKTAPAIRFVKCNTIVWIWTCTMCVL